jgi:hypothetical protein
MSFGHALDSENERVLTERKYGYRCRSQYVEQVERYLKSFPKDQMFFLSMKEMNLPYDNDHIINDVFRFLEVEPNGYIHRDEVKNKTSYRMKTKPVGLISRVLAKLTAKEVVTSIDREAEFKAEFESRRAELAEHFNEYNERLYNLTGVKLGDNGGS